MLETIQEYAAEQLDPAAVRRRHRAWIVRFAAEVAAAGLHTAAEAALHLRA